MSTQTFISAEGESGGRGSLIQEAWFARRRSTLGPWLNGDTSARAVLGIFLIFGTLLGVAASALASREEPARAAPAVPALSPAVPALSPAGFDEVPLPLFPALRRAKLTASDGAVNDSFGYSVAVSRDIAVVGAPYDDTPAGNDAGSVYVFARSGNVWTERARLLASDGTAHDNFGFSVAVDGDTVVVGAWIDDTSGGSDAGSAYVFVRSGNSWTEQAHLTASDGAPFDLFGLSVAVSGDTAVVGADADDTARGTNAGSVYVFVRSGNVWSEQAHLVASDGAPFDLFGAWVAVDGNTAVVTAPGDDTLGGVDTGSAYVFVRSGDVWTEQARLFASDGAEYDYFGGSVAVDGDTVVLGAWDDTDAGTLAGSAYVFVRSGNVWTEQAHLFASDGADYDYFGTNSVAVSGNTIVVGAYGDDTEAGIDAGSAYVFVRSGNVWSERAHLTAPDGAAYDAFGYSVALSRSTALVGASFDTTPAGFAAGSAYVFRH